ncbi:MAG: cytochrome c oxidase subunit II [Sandaracinaceae bacterium]
MLENLLEPASSFAADIDNVILVVTILVGPWFLASMGMFFWLIVRFRHREGQKAQYVTGDEPHLKRWITIPHALIIICDIFIIIAAVRVWMDVKQNAPEPDSTIRVTAQQWAWTFRHPGRDNQLDTDDDIVTVDELHVELDRTYHYQLESVDVLHDFSVPVFRLKQDAIPGRRIMGWFQPILTGTWDIQCAEMCGIGHGAMAARIVVETPEQHRQWVEGRSPGAVATADARPTVQP